jgi:seryl-tRNA synthetase
MKSSQEPFQERDSSLPADQDAGEQMPEALTFEQELEEVEQSLHALKDRYTQVQQDQQLETQFQERQKQIKHQLQRSSSPELKNELKNIQNRLDELEVNLESRLFSWGSLKEPFWQIVRFGGLGVVLGWFLAFAVIQTPKPTPQSSTPVSQSSQL